MAGLGFDPKKYGPGIADLLSGDRLPELGPGSPHEPARPKLVALALDRSLSGHKIVDRAAARCCLAALWLWHDFLGESHEVSQEIDTASGSYWHAIMHRREPDYGNSKYWFRRVRQHPVFALLAAAARELAANQPHDTAAGFLAKSKDWDACKFVDLCQAIAERRSEADSLARQVARVEWRLLFDHCWRAAVGAS
jgi:hypothetical protein